MDRIVSWTTSFSPGIFRINETPANPCCFWCNWRPGVRCGNRRGFFVNVNVCIFVISSELRIFLKIIFCFTPKLLKMILLMFLRSKFSWEMNIWMSNLHHDKSQKANPWKPNKTRWLRQVIRDGNYRPLWGLFGCSPVPNQTIILFIVTLYGSIDPPKKMENVTFPTELRLFLCGD